MCDAPYFLCDVLVTENKETFKKQQTDKMGCVGYQLGPWYKDQFQGYPRYVVSVLKRACPEWVHSSCMVSVGATDAHGRVPER